MKIRSTSIAGLYIIDMFHVEDHRGEFVKSFHKSSFEDAGLEANFEESFYSINHKNVIRGMHFQSPPFDHNKLVYCQRGRISDVILDIRKNSPTFGHYESVELTDSNYQAVYISKGLAHGFESLENHSLLTYLTSTMHQPSHDMGIRFDSFGKIWESANPIVNERDLNFPKFTEFSSPF